ncbi:hypothetical protein GS597_11275 [Synechococcales cyanobacterium C]|uniref:Phytanoyl-CoA dioxygenase n=1 Tax=Petrachloros mirabilis ULC683 TaxID=2781853 RepID=A0A8K1ZZR0_9CYAN|nr:hypothetical protein [Petrachloros mirabilis]NCJ07078.1 hypothetical protein [Petrachloros mirabilis ULC683]
MMKSRISHFLANPFSIAAYNYLVQRRITYPPLRYYLSKKIAKFYPSAEEISPKNISSFKDYDVEQYVKSLDQEGVCFFDALIDSEIVNDIKAHLKDKCLKSKSPANIPYDFLLENAPKNANLAEYHQKDLLSCKHIVNIANHPFLLNIVSRYLECKPTISNVNVIWSFPGDKLKPQAAQNYHRDVDDWKFLKLFVYLTDVETDSGPHCFVQGSHKYLGFTKIGRISDHVINSTFEDSKKLEILGRMGYAFLEDTFAIHKGKFPEVSPRLLLQIEYSLNPNGVYNYVNKIPLKIIQDLNLDPYVNRLYMNGNDVRPKSA